MNLGILSYSILALALTIIVTLSIMLVSWFSKRSNLVRWVFCIPISFLCVLGVIIPLYLKNYLDPSNFLDDLLIIIVQTISPVLFILFLGKTVPKGAIVFTIIGSLLWIAGALIELINEFQILWVFQVIVLSILVILIGRKKIDFAQLFEI